MRNITFFSSPASVMERHSFLSLVVFLTFVIINNVGCSLLLSDATEVETKDNALEAKITATGQINGTAQVLTKNFRICMPDILNPNKTGGEDPTFAQLTNFCNSVLVPIARKMLQDCESSELENFVFACEVSPVTFVEAACEEECREVLLDGNCSNLDRATAVFGVEDTVCLAEQDPEDDSAQPMGATMENRSTCVATGALGSTVTVIRGDDEQAQSADGIVEFSGDLSLGSEISISSILSEVGNFSFDAFGGLADATLKNIFASSSSTTTTTIDPGGAAVFGPFTTVTTGGGDLEKPLAPDDSGRFVVNNDDNVIAGIDLQSGTCTLHNSVDGDDDGTPVEIITDFHGTFVNRPPQANAGFDEVVECTSPAGADVILDCAASTDPDGNIVAYQWHIGSRTGDELGALEELVTTGQELDTTEEYFCNVMDGYWQIATDSRLVKVVDTTAPEIECHAPPSILPHEAPLSFTATAEDICDLDASGSVAIVGYDCFLIHKDRTIDKTESCEVVVDGATITVLDVGGVGTHIIWTVSAVDASGNEAIQECEVVVDKPGN